MQPVLQVPVRATPSIAACTGCSLASGKLAEEFDNCHLRIADRSPALDALTMMSRKPLRSNVSASSGELLMTSSALSTLTFVMLCSIHAHPESIRASERFCCVSVQP